MKYLLAILIFCSCSKTVFNPPALSASVVRNGKYWYSELVITDSIGADTYATVSWTTFDSLTSKNTRVSIKQLLPAHSKRNGFYTTISAEGNLRSVDVKIDTAYTSPYYYQIRY